MGDPFTVPATVQVGGLRVAPQLHHFIAQEALPGTACAPDRFGSRLESSLADLVPTNRWLLARRDAMQAQIDTWYRGRRGKPFDVKAHRALLREIGYLIPEGPDFAVATSGVDAE